MAASKFNFKVLTSLLLFVSFLVLAVSGIVLYMSPAGRVANWTSWNIWGFSKTQWTSFHLTFMVLFLVTGIFHLFYFNWKLFWSYIKTKTSGGFRFKKELGAAIVLSVFLIWGTYAQIPPMSSVVSLGDYLSNSWEENKIQAPTAHAELLTIKQYAETIKESPDKVLSVLREKGYAAEGPDQTLNDLAARYNMPPSQLDAQFKKGNEYESGVKPVAAAGYGKMKLGTLLAELGLDAEEAASRLKAAGVTRFQENQTLREIGEDNGKNPHDIFDILKPGGAAAQ